MKEWLRRLLGIPTLSVEIIRLQSDLDAVSNTLRDIRHNISVTNRAIGRLIAKVEPAYGVDELSPERQAASAKLGDEIIKKLSGEVFESNKYGG